MVRSPPNVSEDFGERPKVTAERDFAEANVLACREGLTVEAIVDPAACTTGDRVGVVGVVGKPTGRPCGVLDLAAGLEPELSFELDLDLVEDPSSDEESDPKPPSLARSAPGPGPVLVLAVASGELCSAPNRTRSLELAGAVKFLLPITAPRSVKGLEGCLNFDAFLRGNPAGPSSYSSFPPSSSLFSSSCSRTGEPGGKNPPNAPPDRVEGGGPSPSGLE
jgi:hypothetical protein